MTGQISELHAWLATHEDGTEGIIASILPGLGSTPLVTSKRQVAERMEGLAREAARTGMPDAGAKAVDVQLVTFVRADRARPG